MTTEITKPPQRNLTIRDYLRNDGMRARLAEVLPKHLSADRMAAVALTAITRTPDLAKCDQASFFQALLSLSQWGLEPDGRRAHLIPFRNNKRGTYDCQLIIDYKGLVELAYRSGLVAAIHADVVCEHDVFEHDRGMVTRHTYDLRQDRGAAYAAYAIVHMKDGIEKAEIMSKFEIDAIRKRSKAQNSGPWVTDYNEMAKKTVFRRLSKWIPLSAEIREAFVEDDKQYADVETTAERVSIDELTDAIVSEVEAES